VFSNIFVWIFNILYFPALFLVAFFCPSNFIARAVVSISARYFDKRRYQRAIGIIEKTFGKEHYKIGIYLNNLADTERKRARFQSALGMYKRALAVIEKNLGPTHSEAAEILFSILLLPSSPSPLPVLAFVANNINHIYDAAHLP
jgi:tetratricopeptide (TPR) repeat protein